MHFSCLESYIYNECNLHFKLINGENAIPETKTHGPLNGWCFYNIGWITKLSNVAKSSLEHLLLYALYYNLVKKLRRKSINHGNYFLFVWILLLNVFSLSTKTFSCLVFLSRTYMMHEYWIMINWCLFEIWNTIFFLFYFSSFFLLFFFFNFYKTLAWVFGNLNWQVVILFCW